MKSLTAGFILLAIAMHAHAQSSSSAQQTSTSQSVAQGTIEFSQTPADQHLSETVRNVSGPVFGAFAPNMSPLGCSSTWQAGGAVPGVSVQIGGPKHDAECGLEVSAAETGREAYNIREFDITMAKQLVAASVQIRCRVNDETCEALVDSGVDCKRAPKDYKGDLTQTVKTADGSTAKVRYVPVYDKADTASVAAK